MSESTRCPQCAADLPPYGPTEPCPACLINLGLKNWANRVGNKVGEGDDTEKPFGTFQSLEPEELAKHFPQLEILELLGVGGMGLVYRARQVGLDRVVALKILPLDVSHDPAFAERFRREAQAMARLNHPNIVAIHDCGRAGEFYYLVMEFVNGVTLRHALRTAALKPQEALTIVPQICEALQFAHDAGIVHRDIKPENILLDKQGRVKLADFGLAKLLRKTPVEYTLTGTGQLMGTVHYMAPEQRDRPTEIDHRVDIYSVGVVLYEMLTGRLPIGRFAPPSEKAQIDVRIDEVVLRALENDRERRYQRVADVQTDIESVGDSSAHPAAATPRTDPTPPPFPHHSGPSNGRHRPRSRRQSTGVELVKIVLGGLAGIALAIVILWYGFGRDPFGVWGGATDGVASLKVQPKGQALPDLDMEMSQPKRSAPRREDPNPTTTEPKTVPPHAESSTPVSPKSHLEDAVDEELPRTTPAVVRVSTDGVFKDMKPKAEIFGNRQNKYWIEIPLVLRGASFFCHANAHQRITRFDVLESGIVIIVTTDRWLPQGGIYGKEHVSREQFEADGWQPIAKMQSFQTESQSLTWTVYAKHCQRGETFAYQTEKYVAPVVIQAPRRR